MANYYRRTVITEPMNIDEDLEVALESRGATLHLEGVRETVLDGIARERPPLTRFAIVFEDGWQDTWGEDVDEFVRDHADLDPSNVSDRAKAIIMMAEENILHEILKLNPDQDLIQMQESWSCSKMRLDGFGGRSTWVTREGYLDVCTSNVEVDVDGTIQLASQFTTWESQKPQFKGVYMPEHDERSTEEVAATE